MIIFDPELAANKFNIFFGEVDKNLAKNIVGWLYQQFDTNFLKLMEISTLNFCIR